MCGGLIKCLGEFVMVVLNLPLMLISVLLTLLGIMITWFFKVLVDSLSNVSSDQNVTDQLNEFLDTIAPYAMEVGITMFVTGIVLLIISVLGCCGACCKSTCMMVLYAVSVGLVTAALVTITIVYAVDQSVVTGPLRDQMQTSIQNHFNDPDNPMYAGNFSSIVDTFTAGIVVVIRPLPCCGIANYTDFQYSGKWNRDYKYGDPLGEVTNAMVPVMCCQNTELTGGYYKPKDVSCLQQPTNQNSYMDTTCFAYLQQQLGDVMLWILVALSVIVAVVFLLAVYLAYRYNKRGFENKNSTQKATDENNYHGNELKTMNVAYFVSGPDSPAQGYYLVKRV